MTAPGPGLLLLSVGGYRSGSTYAYNLVGEYVERANAGRRVGYLEPEQVALLEGLWSVVRAMGFAVGKAHHSPAIPEGGQWQGLLDAGRVVPFCTTRDWRDVLFSFSRVYQQTPEEVLASRRWQVNVENMRWWLQRGALRIRYDDLMAAPGQVLVEVGSRAGLPYELEAGEEAVGAATADPDETPRGQFSDAEADRRTLLHDGHVATPYGGAWHVWDAATRERVDAALAPLRAEFG